MAVDNSNRNYPGIGWVRELGYPKAEAPMQAEVNRWWSWYRSQGEFYAYEETSADGKGTFKVERISFSPAKMVCEDWAGIFFNYRTGIGFEGVTDLEEGVDPENEMQEAYDWLQGWVDDVRLLTDATSYERCFGLGTYAFALRLNDVRIDGQPSEDTSVDMLRFDARSIVPLTWDANGHCSECAFPSEVMIDGKPYTQWLVYLKRAEGYEINTAFFKGNGQRVELDGYSTVVTTGLDKPPFVLIRPAIDNTYLNHGPFGVSIFDGAIGTVKLADGSFDNTWKDVFLGQKMMFIPEEMLQRNDEDGSYTVPREKDQQLFMAKPEGAVGDGNKTGIDEYNPDLRVDQNRTAIDTALSLLGKRVGFGFKYYSLDSEGGLKTAKEVASDNAELMRNAKKHEQLIGASLEELCEAAASLSNLFCGTNIPDLTGKVTILFGDTIIQDEDTERERMRADVAAGLVPKWKYVTTHYGVDVETAKEWTREDTEIPIEA